jgi:hypothetical protein
VKDHSWALDPAAAAPAVQEDEERWRARRARPTAAPVRQATVIELPTPRRLGERGPRVIGVMSDAPRELLEELGFA